MQAPILFGYRWVANMLLFLAIGLIVLAANLSYRNLAKYKAASEYVNNAHLVLIAAEGIMSNMLQMESSARGYMLTGNSFFLHEVEATRFKHRNYMDNLDMLISDKAQIIEMGILVKVSETQFSLIDIIVAKGNATQSHAMAVDTALLNRSAFTLGKVRQTIKRFIGNQSRLLDERTRVSKNRFSAAYRTEIGGLVVSIFCILLFYGAVRAQNKRLDHLNHDLEKTNKWLSETRSGLEREVEARTRDLAHANRQLAQQYSLQTEDLDRKRSELQDAAHFQRALLPLFDFPDDCWEIGAIMKPALEVGGDYYDYKYLEQTGTITLAIGDAAGHGLMASMIVSTVRSLFQTFGATGNVQEIFGQITDNLLSLRIRSAFMALSLIRMRRFEIEIVSAGMPPFLLYHRQQHTVETLPLKSIFLGSPYNPEYAQYKAHLQAGDILLCFSDGITESRNLQGEIYGHTRLSELLLSLAEEPVQEICNEIQAEEREWSGRMEPYDDISIMAIRMRG